MEGGSSSSELQSIQDAIRCSDVVENRIELLTKLGDLKITEKSELASLAESLTTFWEDYTCLDISQCMLNGAILQVAAKYLESDISICLAHFLALGTKASIWCGKHLKMTLMSTEESQEEEHAKLFFELLLDLLSFSGASFSFLARFPVSVNKLSLDIVEKFFVEQLNLIKDSISEIKRIQCFESVVKVTLEVIDAVIRLCGAYARAVNWESWDEKLAGDKTGMDVEGVSNMNHVINVTKYTIEKLCEIGIVAANNGGSLVKVLNFSWKGVVTLLQLGEGVLATKVNVADIISNLISLVNESLRCAAEAWSSSLKETISVTEARKTFLPVKFYLINAIKISSLYPCQAYLLLKTAADVFTELLEKASLDLLISLLNSSQMKQEFKGEILDSLFSKGSYRDTVSKDLSKFNKISSLDEIFSLCGEAFPGEKALLLGRVSLFLGFLKFSVDLEEDVKLGITRKLGWFLDILIDEDVYSSILLLEVPGLYGSGETVEVVRQPMFSFLLNALEIFMLVVSPSPAWRELESFLLENIFHPHFLCWEIVMELWCFMLRYAEPGMASGIIGKLCSLLKFVASAESVLVPGSALRKLARSISMLLTFGAQSMVDQVYMSIVSDDGAQLSSVMRLALFMEGFPLNLLSDKMKSIATQRIITDYYVFVENFDDKSMRSFHSGAFGVPVFALSASLQSLPISISDIDVKTLKFLVAIIHNYRVSSDKLMKERYCKLLSETLGIISKMNHLYASDEMEKVIFELENLFISGPAASDTQLYECKPNLALFMAGLAHMEINETNQSAKTSVLWELYHMLLRERHWAFIHLAIAAFGYFSARTCCNALWRFVPQDAALSYDLVSANEASVERFMSQFKIFLEKETALLAMTPSSDQLGLLVREGLTLKEMFQKKSNVIPETTECENMEIDCKKQTGETNGGKQTNKKRKLPDGIRKGMELLESGMKVIVDGLSQWQRIQSSSDELHEKFLSNFSRLEDEVAQLIGLAGTD
ncbi:uncharacterized protein Pyn_17368 [Prunus yedoensis var. nudiflora]|uniref:Uncharacterized protein n=1 Tax=Prunus yedoensis var. nudiflora TaxID=2094558 RepID=A0A314UYA1_PRUYE|nr:uncharacterized protein Pyn_17368 [Prunus yedoensis var. nudiflora]